MLLTKYCRQSKFTDKNAPGLNLELDEDFQASNCFTELIRGYTMGVVEPYCKNLNEPSTQLSEFQILFAPLTNRSHKAQNQVS